MKRNIKIVIGLGNPGSKYEDTYHNVGILCLDFMAQQILRDDELSYTLNPRFSYLKTKTIIFIKPQMYMNASGTAVHAALAHFRIQPDAMLVAHDDSDITLGNYKVAFNRGAAGHRGVESVIKVLGTKEFWRLRIGIRKTGIKNQELGIRRKAGEMVLRKISKVDFEVLESVFKQALVQLSESMTKT